MERKSLKLEDEVSRVFSVKRERLCLAFLFIIYFISNLYNNNNNK